MAVLFVLLISFGITAYAMVTTEKKPAPEPAPVENPAVYTVQERDTVKQVLQVQTHRRLSEKEARSQEKEFENAFLQNKRSKEILKLPE